MAPSCFLFLSLSLCVHRPQRLTLLLHLLILTQLGSLLKTTNTPSFTHHHHFPSNQSSSQGQTQAASNQQYHAMSSRTSFPRQRYHALQPHPDLYLHHLNRFGHGRLGGHKGKRLLFWAAILGGGYYWWYTNRSCAGQGRERGSPRA